TDGQADLVEHGLVHSGAARDRGRDQACGAHVLRKGAESQFHGGHAIPLVTYEPDKRGGTGLMEPPASPDALSVFRWGLLGARNRQSLACTASSTEVWIGNTLVRPVIRKILRMRSWLQTRRSEPSWARTRFRPPTSTPSPVESRKSTPSMSTTRWKFPSFTSSTSCSRSLGAVYTSISPPTRTTVRSPMVSVDRDRSTDPPAPCYRAVALRPPRLAAPRTHRQPRWHSITYRRRARRLDSIVRHAS